MPLKFKSLILLLSIAALAADKENSRFVPLPAAQYPNHQASNGVTIGASAFETDAQAQPAFGKVNPYKLGVLPVLVVIQNNSKSAIRADRLEAQYIGPDREKIVSTPARDLAYLNGPQRPRNIPINPLPAPIPGLGKKKSPLAEWQIEGRAFSAKMIPPGESASGFFYFQTGHRSGSVLYLSGLRDAATGQDLLYFELPLENVR